MSQTGPEALGNPIEDSSASSMPLAVADSLPKAIYRLISTDKGLCFGDHDTLQEAWEKVKQSKGKMLLWEIKPYFIEDKFIGYIPTQMPLRYYSPKEKLLFRFKQWRQKLSNWKKLLRR